MRPVTSIAFLLFMAMTAEAQQPSGTPIADTCGDLFYEKLKRCESFECQMPHPFEPGFVLKQRIFGREGTLCHADQTAPPVLLFDCRYSQPTIDYLTSSAAREATKPGSRVQIKIGPDGTSASAGGQKLEQEFAQRECSWLVDERAIGKLDPAQQAEMRKIAGLLQESRQRSRQTGTAGATPTR